MKMLTWAATTSSVVRTQMGVGVEVQVKYGQEKNVRQR